MGERVRDGGGLYQAGGKVKGSGRYGGKGEGWGWAVPGRGGR